MKKKMKFKSKYYSEATPVIMKMVGDALLYISLTGATIAILAESKAWSIGLLIIGGIGKALTNGVGEVQKLVDDNNAEQNEQPEQQ